jgi:hypothetical protein
MIMGHHGRSISTSIVARGVDADDHVASASGIGA